jgi:hypothetical protein
VDVLIVHVVRFVSARIRKRSRAVGIGEHGDRFAWCGGRCGWHGMAHRGVIHRLRLLGHRRVMVHRRMVDCLRRLL